MNTPLLAGVIGGGNIANAHLRGMTQSARIRPVALCDINESALSELADQYAIPAAHRYTDYRRMLDAEPLDMVSICTPNITHYEIAMAAVDRGIPYALEKPVAMTLQQAKALRDATEAKGLANTVCFSYRYLPAVQQAKALIESGALGRIHHAYVQYIEGKDDNERLPLLWRYQKELAGSGSLGDLGSHSLDMMRYLVGGMDSVCGVSGILIPKRKRLDGSGYGDVTTEDYFHALIQMENGVSATAAFTKFAWGRKNAHRVEVYGGCGGLIFTLEKGVDRLRTCLGEAAGRAGEWTDVELNRTVPSQMECFADRLQGIPNSVPATIGDGYAVQAVMEAMMSADAERRWIDVR